VAGGYLIAPSPDAATAATQGRRSSLAHKLGSLLKSSCVANDNVTHFFMNRILFRMGAETVSKLASVRKSSALDSDMTGPADLRRWRDSLACDVRLPSLPQSKRRRRMEGSGQNGKGFKGGGMFLER
jgi:hypothetical protein